jgi:exodeoxyribonuclease V gamma subunit
MLHLFKARHIEPLADKYFEVNKNKVRPLLETYPVIVPNMAIGRWLVHYLTNRQSICANLEQVMPGAFLWRLTCQLNASLPALSEFNEEVLVFRVLALLDDDNFVNKFPRLSHYLDHCGSGDKVELAKKIAKVFDQYQIYRTDWLEQWKNGNKIGLGDDENWQQTLWQRLVAQSEQPHRALLEEQLAQTILQRPESLDLPQSLCLFGITTLTPGFIKVINALGKHCDTYLFSFSSDETEKGVDKGTEVLSHWKESGHGFYAQLHDRLSSLVSHDEPQNYLQYLQNVLSGKSLTQTSPSASPGMDDSITSVCCYSPMREIEAIHDYLLKLFDAKKDWNPGDVLIALPDLETYSPYIRAVFDASDKKIPYYITDSLAASESPLINGLMELLTLPKWRFTREQVMVLLHNRLVQNRFNITDIDIEQIESWLDDAGVCWGINAQHWQEFDLPANDEHTWQAGLDRLLLGFALPKGLDTGTSLFRGVLPVDEVEGSASELLSDFVDYYEKLIHWRKLLKQAYSIHEWQLQLQTLVNDFFVMDTNEEQNQIDLMKLFDQLASDAQQVCYEKKVDVDAITVLLNEGISSNDRDVRLSGSINIASMSSLASLPFKQVCLVGMNFDSWPSRQRQPGFDLMSKNVRAGDRNRSLDERYLTLQLILSAQEALYLSYTGRNIHNGEKIPPSVLLSELIDVSEMLGNKITTYQHPMHAYSADNFSSDSSSRSPLFQSHSPMWLETARRTGQGRKIFPRLCHSNDLPEPVLSGPIELDDVLRFFTNPQAYFLRNRLGIFLNEESKSWENTEPFDLRDFADSQVRKIALNQALNGMAGSSAAVARATGLLPHAEYGDLLQQMEQDKVDALMESLSNDYLTPVLTPLVAEISVNGFQLNGVLRDLRPEGQLVVLADELYPYQKIQCWLQHLFLCCVAPEGIICETRIHSLAAEIRLNRPENPQDLLAKWLEAYLQGQQSPLSFYAKTSWEYAKNFNKTSAEDKALKAARKKWDDNYHYPGENAKPANQYLYRGHDPLNADFQALASSLLMPLIEHEENT